MFLRSKAMLGESAMEKLADSHVALFGVGGVGSYCAEILIRTGLGSITLIDYDKIDITNINRQIHATIKTVGKSKVLVMKERLKEINPNAKVYVYNKKYDEENKDLFPFNDYDYIIDAIDMISSKISLIEVAKKHGIPIISAMGAGNKLDPTGFKVGDIFETKVCPLARVMRRELRKREITGVKAVWSEETPMKLNLGDGDKRKAIPASIAFVPSVVGIIIGSEVIKDMIQEDYHGTNRSSKEHI